MLSNVICLFFLLSGHTCYSFLFWFVDLTFFGRRNGLFWQVSHTPDKQVTRLVVIYWSLAGPQPTDQVLEAPSVWKMPLQTRSANLKGPLLENFIDWSEACGASARQGESRCALNQLICQLTLCRAITNWAVYISCPTHLLILCCCCFALSLCILLLLVQAHPASAPASTCRLCLFMAPQGVVIDLSLLLLWPVKEIMLPGRSRNRVWRQSESCICIYSQQNVYTKCMSCESQVISLRSTINRRAAQQGENLQQSLYQQTPSAQIMCCYLLNWMFALHCEEWYMFRVWDEKIVFHIHLLTGESFVFCLSLTFCDVTTSVQANHGSIYNLQSMIWKPVTSGTNTGHWEWTLEWRRRHLVSRG